MPLYDFRCKNCGLEFEVSRPLARATDPAFCPMDSSEADRVFTMPGTFIRNNPGDSVPKPPTTPQGGGWSHFGHSHGAGAGGHSHGAGGAP
jgi:putative FmdB family regulatory protein